MTEDKFIVRQIYERQTKGCALKFHTNSCGKQFVTETDECASHFDSAWEAELKAKEHGLREGCFYVEQINTVGTSSTSFPNEK